MKPEGVQTSSKPEQAAGGHGSGQKSEGNPSDGAPQKTKAQLKAERRAKQEAQRAAKAAKKAETGVKKPEGKKQGGSQGDEQKGGGGGGGKQTNKPDGGKGMRVNPVIQADNDKELKRRAKQLEKQQVPQRKSSQRKVGLFSHLHQYEREVSLTKAIKFSSASIHPAILRLGLQYSEGIICGSNARCIAMLAAIKQVISDYSTPPQKELSRDLDAKIKPCISFLTQCRPLSVSMGNAIKYIKRQINHVPSDKPDAEAKEELCQNIDDFAELKIRLAGKAISQEYAITKITDGDVIVVYACSSLITKVLCDAYDKKLKFRVIVVDGRPKMEGREMLRRLVRHGIKCSYTLISAASYVMREATKVFLGAHALLANGFVMSRVGSSQIALVAKSYNVPVLVCCETYKFCERVQTDSFVFNELGDPADLVSSDKTSQLTGWKQKENLSLLNLVYDVTPPELITMVITEIGMVPCTSVPVVLRVRQAEIES